MITRKQKNLWIFLAALGAVMWGISGLFAKALFNFSRQITPLWLTQIRLVVAGVVLLLLAKGMGQKPIHLLRNKRHALVIFAYAVFGLLPVQLFYFIVVQEANASIATILQFIGPFFVIAYLALSHQQVMRRLDLLAAVIAFAGVFLLSTHGHFNHLALTPVVLFWGLLSAVGEAAYTLIPVHLVQKVSSLVITGWGMIMAGLGIILVHPQLPRIPNQPQVWLYTLAVILIGTIIPFQIMATALRYVRPATVSLLDAFEPLSATLGSVLIFHLPMTGMDWLGSILVVIAVMALNITPPKKRNKTHG